MSARTDRGGDVGGFAHFAKDLRSLWWLVLITVALMGYVGYAVSSVLDPKYSATARVVYSQRDADAVTKALVDAGTAGLPLTLSSDALVFETAVFSQRVSDALDGILSPETIRASLDIAIIPDVVVIEIETSAVQGDLAAHIANASADEFIKIRQEELGSSLESALEFVQGRIDSLAPAEQSGSLASELERQRYTLNALLDDSIADYKILEVATAPASPYFPNPVVSILLGLFAGLVLGALLAWLIGSIDRRIKDRVMLAQALDLPVIGTLPTASAKQGGRRASVGFTKGSEHMLEPTMTLRSNLKILGFGDSKRTLLITSTASKEGKSPLAIDLTVSMALSGDRVILVDADLRDPSIHSYLGIPNDQGLGDMVAAGSVDWSNKVQAIDLAPFVQQSVLDARKAEGRDSGVTKFLCLTAGARPSDLAKALEGATFSSLLVELQGYSDYVIINGPSMVATSDALILARSADAVILTSTLGKQTAAETRQVRQLLARADIEPLGVVLFGDHLETQDLGQA